jgi:hypothetical protein
LPEVQHAPSAAAPPDPPSLTRYPAYASIGNDYQRTPGQQPPGDDTALLIAALNHTWAWYDAQISHSIQVVNYALVGVAILATAYVGAINGKHYPLAAVVTVAGIGLTGITALLVIRQNLQTDLAEPVLAGLQRQVVGTSLAGTTGTERRIERVFRSGVPGMVALGVALLVEIGALLYALIH